MLVWVILLISLSFYIILEVIPQYKNRQLGSFLIGGGLWLIILVYSIALQMRYYYLPSPAWVFELFKPLAAFLSA